LDQGGGVAIMATATFDKRIIIDKNDAKILVNELERVPVGPPAIEQDFMTVNEKEVDIWLSSFAE
jgi:hypothetical protein